MDVSSSTRSDLLLSIEAVEKVCELSRAILAFANLCADGGSYSERSGEDVSDESDVIIRKLESLELWIDAAGGSIPRCREPLRQECDEIVKRGECIQPMVDSRLYHSFHEALLAVGVSIAGGVRKWAYNLNGPITVGVAGFHPPIDKVALRSNMRDACRSLVDHGILQHVDTMGRELNRVPMAEMLNASIARSMLDIYLFYAQRESRAAAAAAGEVETRDVERVHNKPAAIGAPPFVFSTLQRDIYSALDGAALKVQPLADAVAGGDKSRLYRPGGLKEMKAAGLVDHKNKIGYYRLDSPPKGMTPNQLATN